MDSVSWEFECLIPGPPIGKGRPRATKMGAHIRLYTPQRTVEWEKSAALLARNAWMRAPSEDYCKLEVVAVFPRPKRLLRKKDPDSRMWHGSKPDIDNVVNSVADSLVMAGVIRDDTQVVEIHARKVYAAKSEGPGGEVRLCSIDIEPPAG